ncbi:uncharacterized protein LOC129944770 [Eupeodes corollae]|uniref:uncharacterized protein LOC129944770 n=1 Tax=Eupeodes corollae TaxID=290404 RepID=UPI0024901306|nr:uncharacterized protein LOC129944770 [Eupeodes corollae]
MSIFCIISLMVLFQLVIPFITNYDHEHLNVISTIEYITRTFTHQRQRTLTFSANAENKTALSIFGDMVDRVLKRIDFAKVQIDQNNCEMIGLREFNILLVDSFKAFEHIDPANKTKSYDFNEYYLIFLKAENSKQELLKILDYCWKHYIINVIVIVEQSSEVLNFYTYFPFSKLKCRNTEPVLINQFKNGVPTNVYGTNHIFPNKLENLQGCLLIAALWNVPPYLRIVPNRTGLDQFVGIEGNMLKAIAKTLNFSLGYITPPNDEERGIIFPNGTTSGATKLIEERKADLSFGCFRYSMARAKVMSAASPYYQTWVVSVVLKSPFKYTPIEILVFPFTSSTWISLLAFFGVIISFRLLAIYYHKVLGPLLVKITVSQLVSNFLGGPMANLPKGNFIRCMLMLWVIFAFIIRSAYQSLLFTLLQHSLYKKPPKTLKELVDLDYTFVLNKSTFYFVKDMLEIEQAQYIFPESPLTFIEHNSGKFAAIMPQDFVRYFVMTYSKRETFHILSDKVVALYNTMYFSKHSYLIDRFRGILKYVGSSGLINVWYSQNMHTSYFDAVKYDKEALKLNNLKGAFDVYLVLLLVAFVVFLVELLSKRVMWLKKLFK